MSLFSLIKNATYDKPPATYSKVNVTQDVPFNLCQGSLVELPQLEIALAQAEGSLIKAPESNDKIIAVGSYRLLNHEVFHSYLSDGKSFLRTIKGTDEVYLFTPQDEIFPANSEDWDFWLNDKEGLIGWSQFQVDNNTPIVYNREWDKVNFVEDMRTLTNQQGIIHEGCEYARILSSGTQESLLVYTSQGSGYETSVNIFIGIPLPSKDVKVLKTT